MASTTNPTNLEIIKAYNAKHAAAAQIAPTQLPKQQVKLLTTSTMSVNDIALIQKSADPNQTLTNDEQIRLKALETKENLRLSAEQQKREQERSAKLQETFLAGTRKGIAVASAPVIPAVNRFANLPTPGGLMTIILLLIIFVLAIVPISNPDWPVGTTRLKLVWLTLSGKTHLRYQDTTPNNNITSFQQSSQQQTTQPPIQLHPNTDIFGSLNM